MEVGIIVEVVVGGSGDDSGDDSGWHWGDSGGDSGGQGLTCFNILL